MEILRYSSYDIVLQEIPNEITLAFSITGCQLNCLGCHSEYLFDGKKGTILNDDLLRDIIIKYDKLISCVLFMGGEWAYNDLISKLKIIKGFDLKTALYTGLNSKQMSKSYQDVVNELDYLKTGKWIENLGGLNSVNTNQVLINVKTGEILNKYLHVK